MMTRWIDKAFCFLQEKEKKKETLLCDVNRQKGVQVKRLSLFAIINEWRETDIKKDKDKTPKYFYRRVWISIGLLFGGVILGIVTKNYMSILPLGIGLFSLPYLLVSLEAQEERYKHLEQEEVSASVLTGQYISEESLEKAVKTALPYLEGAIKEDMMWLLTQSNFINADTQKLFEQLIERANKERKDALLAEWYLQLQKAQKNKESRKEVYEVVEQMSEKRIASREFVLSLAPIKKEFYILCAFVPASRLIMLLLNHDWYNVLQNTVSGQIVTSLTVWILLLCLHRFFRLCAHDDSVRIHKQKDENELFRFVKHLRHELNHRRDLQEILETYSFVATGKLKAELKTTIGDMQTGNYETALIRLDRRYDSQTMSDICRGLCAFLQGEVKEAYWQVIERKILDEERAQRNEINKERIHKIHSMGLVLLSTVMGLFLTVMVTQIIEQLGVIFS